MSQFPIRKGYNHQILTVRSEKAANDVAMKFKKSVGREIDILGLNEKLRIVIDYSHRGKIIDLLD